MSYTTTEWAFYKKAVAEYSTIRPRRVYEEWEPALNVKEQTLPRATIIGIESINYGVRESVPNVLLSEDTTQGWAEENGIFYITPVVTEATTLLVTWKEIYVPDDLTQQVPSLPTVDLPIVEKLYEAYQLEAEAREVLSGPIKYTVGQKSFSRETVAENLLKRAKTLRFEVSLETGGSAAEFA